MKIEQAIAIYGAGLSTLLAIATLLDRLRHPVPRLIYNFTGSEEEGNQIVLANPTPKPLLIEGWELYWAKVMGFRLLRTLPLASSVELGGNVFTVAAHGTKELTFSEAQHFGWGKGFAKFGHLYIELRIVGRRRPIVLHVYDPASFGAREPWSLRRLLPHRLRPSPVY